MQFYAALLNNTEKVAKLNECINLDWQNQNVCLKRVIKQRARMDETAFVVFSQGQGCIQGWKQVTMPK